MVKKWGPIFLGVAAVIGVLLFALQQIFVKTTLSEQEIINRVESLYNGSVEDITKNTEHYNVVFSDGAKVYEVLVDEEQGTFHHLTLLAQRDEKNVATNVSPQDETTEPAVSQSKETSNSSNTSSKDVPKATPESSVDKQATNNTPVEKPKITSIQITEQSATNIALQQLNGEVEDVELFSSADGGYYIVEIETDEQEAAFQIHAITGKILSVVYDD